MDSSRELFAQATGPQMKDQNIILLREENLWEKEINF